jgi:hypothetical protein
MYNVADWYWTIGDDTSQVWSSARAGYIPVSDQAYVDFLVGRRPAHAETIEALEADVFAKSYPRGSLVSYSVFARDLKLNGGIVVNGLPFATDPITTMSLNSAYIYTIDKNTNEFSWKLPDGSFITLSTADIKALQSAVASFGQACYDCEDTTLTGLEGGTITTFDQIDAAFAAVNTVFTGLSKEATASVRHKRK